MLIAEPDRFSSEGRWRLLFNEALHPRLAEELSKSPERQALDSSDCCSLVVNNMPEADDHLIRAAYAVEAKPTFLIATTALILG